LLIASAPHWFAACWLGPQPLAVPLHPPQNPARCPSQSFQRRSQQPNGRCTPAWSHCAFPATVSVNRPVFAIVRRQFLPCGGCTATRGYFTVAAGSCVRVAFLASGASRA